VVETLFIDGRNDGIATFVLGMAGSAIVFLEPAVKTGFLTNVRCCFLVAVQAELGLARLIELGVAFAAIRFEFGMAGNDFSRHQHAFEAVGMRK